jgi:hypothetical protein
LAVVVCVAVSVFCPLVEVGVDAPPELHAAATTISTPTAIPAIHREEGNDGTTREMTLPCDDLMSVASFRSFGEYYDRHSPSVHMGVEILCASTEGEVVGLHPG